MRKYLKSNRELGKSHSFFSVDALASNSSYTVLADGTIKRKRIKTSYKDIYLDKLNYSSKTRTITHSTSPSYSRYNELKRKNDDPYDLDDMAYYNNRIKTKVINTTSSSCCKEPPKTWTIDLPLGNTLENQTSRDSMKRTPKNKRKTKDTDGIDLNYPLQISQDRESRERKSSKKNSNHIDGMISISDKRDSQKDENSDKIKKNLEKYLNDNDSLIQSKKSERDNRTSSNRENSMSSINKQIPHQKIHNSNVSIQDFEEGNYTFDNKLNKGYKINQNMHIVDQLDSNDKDYQKMYHKRNTDALEDEYQLSERNINYTFKKGQLKENDSDLNNEPYDEYYGDEDRNYNSLNKNNNQNEDDIDENEKNVDEFSVHENDNYRYDINNNLMQTSNNGGNTDEMTGDQLLLGSASNAKDDNQGDNNDNDDQYDMKDLEECHQIYLTKNDNELLTNPIQAHIQKSYGQISEIVEEENEDTLINSQKLSANKHLMLSNYTYSNNNKENGDVSAISSQSNNCFCKEDNQLQDNKMSIEELTALNEQNKSNAIKTKGKKRDFQELVSVDKSIKDNTSNINDNCSSQSTMFKQDNISMQLSHLLADYKSKAQNSSSHFELKIENKTPRVFKEVRISNSPSINFNSVNKPRDRIKLKSEHYSIFLPGFPQKTEKEVFKIPKEIDFSIETINSINILSNRKSHTKGELIDDEVDYGQYTNENMSRLRSNNINTKDKEIAMTSETGEITTRKNEEIKYQYSTSDKNKTQDQISIKTLRAFPRSFSPIISITELTMPNGCIQKKNEFDLNKMKEDLSKVQIDDLISKVKDKNSKRKYHHSKKSCQTQDKQNHNALLSVNDPQIENIYGNKLFSRPDSSGNMINIKNKEGVNAATGDFKGNENIHFINNYRNSGLSLRKYSKANKDIHCTSVLKNKESKKQTMYKTHRKGSNMDCIKIHPNYVMPANTLETVLIKREELFFNSTDDANNS